MRRPVVRRSVEAKIPVQSAMVATLMDLADHLKGTVDALSDLVARHIELARVELKEDAQVLGTQVAKIAAFMPLLVVGYGLFCLAAALFLRRYLPIDAAFFVVAATNFAVGGIGILLALRKLKQRRVLMTTLEELRTTAVVLTSQGQ